MGSGVAARQGHHDLEVEEWLYCLQEDAEAAGGAVHSLLGNHEALNAIGDHSMAAREAFVPFNDLKPEIEAMLKGDWGRLANLPEQMRCRFAAMLPRGPVATMLAGHPVVMKLMSVNASACSCVESCVSRAILVMAYHKSHSPHALHLQRALLRVSQALHSVTHLSMHLRAVEMVLCAQRRALLSACAQRVQHSLLLLDVHVADSCGTSQSAQQPTEHEPHQCWRHSVCTRWYTAKSFGHTRRPAGYQR
eukprot:15366-Heterococcus_DN1.PRE.4